MTIDEAIKQLRQRRGWSAHRGDTQHVEALNLGIEALKYIKDHPDTWGSWNPDVLPGETEAVKRGLTETIFINPERD